MTQTINVLPTGVFHLSVSAAFVPRERARRNPSLFHSTPILENARNPPLERAPLRLRHPRALNPMMILQVRLCRWLNEFREEARDLTLIFIYVAPDIRAATAFNTSPAVSFPSPPMLVALFRRVQPLFADLPCPCHGGGIADCFVSDPAH